MIFTHKGWFALCPAYIFYPNNSLPEVVSRNELLYNWMIINEYLMFMIAVILKYTIGWFIKEDLVINPFHHIEKLEKPINLDAF